MTDSVYLVKYKEKYVIALCNIAPVMTSFLNVMNTHHNELGTHNHTGHNHIHILSRIHLSSS